VLGTLPVVDVHTPLWRTVYIIPVFPLNMQRG
jgi:hypothetical protein